MYKSRSGFTIVELLIVIVVIGILAALVVTTFAGVQARAHDTQRINDANNIVKALQSYKAIHGSYPEETPGCWENSDDTSFIEYLTPTYGLPQPPADPVNSGYFYYSYCRYPATSSSCGTEGHYVVVGIRRFESPFTPKSSSWQCGTRNWYPEYDWSWGAFD